jgi:hypothetical protein
MRPDDSAWRAANDAGGATPARLRAAEQLLASGEPGALPTQLVDRLVAGAIAAGSQPPQGKRRTATRCGLMTIALLVVTAMAAVGPRWIWPERLASVLTL